MTKKKKKKQKPKKVQKKKNPSGSLEWGGLPLFYHLSFRRLFWGTQNHPGPFPPPRTSFPLVLPFPSPSYLVLSPSPLLFSRLQELSEILGGIGDKQKKKEKKKKKKKKKPKKKKKKKKKKKRTTNQKPPREGAIRSFFILQR